MEPVDLADPSWTIRQGQAVWRPKSGATEVAGELLVARSPAWGDFVRFSKGPVEVVVARQTTEGWQLDLPSFDKSFSGRGHPPKRVGWFQLTDFTFLDPGDGPWRWEISPNLEWSLENSRTGERLEGFYKR